MAGVSDIQGTFVELQRKRRQHLPKVGPALVDDLLLRQMQNPDASPMYTLEVFTKPGLDPDAVRRFIIEKTGMSPAIYDNGTHYVTNQRLNLAVLKEISDSDDVVEVTGEYRSGLGAYGASHERHAEREGRAGPYRPPSTQEQQATRRTNNLVIAGITAAGIIGALVIAGLAISGGIAPNTNAGDATREGVPGIVHGYVGGPNGLPAVGATVIATGENTDYQANAFVSLDGKYIIEVPNDTYVLTVAYPDGSSKVARGVEVGSGSSTQLDFSY